MGYMSVKAAVDSLVGRRVERNTDVDFSVITLDNMYSPENQRLLFPFAK